ncbi:hypothetical protein VW35_10950 [Devosia soli]|uniref:Uncharacterized protein n=1 Tax=Devosia soli TaxID=361041 RepID=A0A0F5L7K0_9HYPH|nr:hypothetical protein [Devosia soli]KKB78179.1 hypothetical protein VW35_10950 [Devosia soli]
MKLQKILFAIALILAGIGTPAAEETSWPAEKCRGFAEAWGRALETYGSDNINYNFLAQNENFIANGCTAQVGICPQSDQELEIANAITFEMMNFGAASTFLPYRCETSSRTVKVSEASPQSVEAQLCRSQLELLLRGGKLTEDEAAVFEAQCTCLERGDREDRAACAQ